MLPLPLVLFPPGIESPRYGSHEMASRLVILASRWGIHQSFSNYQVAPSPSLTEKANLDVLVKIL